jgi:hypothetical protein
VNIKNLARNTQHTRSYQESPVKEDHLKININQIKRKKKDKSRSITNPDESNMAKNMEQRSHSLAVNQDHYKSNSTVVIDKSLFRTQDVKRMVSCASEKRSEILDILNNKSTEQLNKTKEMKD